MDAKAWYWTAAWLNMAVVTVLAGLAVRKARRTRYDAHRRLMLTSTGLVAFFVFSYVAKLAVLGREDRAAWAQSDLYVLYVHELCVATMLIGGGIALWQALRLGLPHTDGRTSSLSKAEVERGVRLHRRAGLTALIAAFAGVISAAYVLSGMYARL